MASWLQTLLTSNEIIAAVVTVLLAALVEFIQRKFAPRGRVRWAVAHQFAYRIQPRPMPALPAASNNSQANVPQPADATTSTPYQSLIRTRQIWIQNVGRAPVTDLEIVLNYAPEHFEIWPQRAYEKAINPENRLVIQVASLASREFFTIGMIDIKDLPEVMNVRSSDGIGRQVAMGPQQIYPRWILELLRFVLIVGAFSLIYWFVRVVRLLTG